MRAGRLLSILILLQLRGRVSAADLAREFEVSVRTIYRDIDQLSASGVPVYAERGRDGGFALLDGYRTKLTGLSSTEAETLVFAGISGAASDLGMGAEAKAAHLKLLAGLSPDAGAGAQRTAARFHLDPSGWFSLADPTDCLPALAEAVWRERQIRIGYQSWKSDVERDLDPLGLVLKAGAWYLVAAAVKGLRTYRVSRISKLEVLPTSFKRPAAFDLADHWIRSTRDFQARLVVGSARVRLSPAGLDLLADVNPIAAHAARANARPSEPAGWIETEFPVEAHAYSAKLLLRLGDDVRVLDPADLRVAVAQEAR